MHRFTLRTALLIGLISTLLLNPTLPVGANDSQGFYDKSFENAFFDEVFAFYPTWGLQSGFHKYDEAMESLDQKRIDAFKDKLKAYDKQIDVRLGQSLAMADRHDLMLMKGWVQGQILEWDTIKMYARDPDRYPSQLADSVFSVVKRDFAPLDDRMRMALARLKTGLSLLDQAKANILPQQVPPIYVDIALEQIQGTRDLLADTIPKAFAGVKDQKLQDEYHAVNLIAISKLDEYREWLKNVIKPQANGNWAIGATNYSLKLHNDEMIDEDLDKILHDGYDELHRLQKQFKDCAMRLATLEGKTKDIDENSVFANISSDHPKPQDLVSATQGVLQKLATFVSEHDIATVPAEHGVTVAESPSYLRAITFASMDTPGPYETRAKEAFYYVTPPEPEGKWDKQKIEEHMRFFSYPDLINTSVHEAYPGHYLQFLQIKNARSKTRKLLGCSSNAEGWAHYCEEMMLDQGLGHDADNKKILAARMVQIHDALLRACRYIVGIEMHTRGMSYESAKQFFIKEGFMESANAERETKRGTKDPTYLVYTLGKLRIIKLRTAYMKAFPDADLKKFHDKFLATGFAPLCIVEAEMLAPQTEQASVKSKEQHK